MSVRMKSATAPKDRTLQLLTARGWLAADVETKRGHATFDLFGFGDVIAAHPTRRESLIVQCTSASNIASRIAKVTAHPNTALVLQAGVRVEVWGWGDEAMPRVHVVASAVEDDGS
jgi:hypothetical protein